MPAPVLQYTLALCKRPTSRPLHIRCNLKRSIGASADSDLRSGPVNSRCSLIMSAAKTSPGCQGTPIAKYIAIVHTRNQGCVDV